MTTANAIQSGAVPVLLSPTGLHASLRRIWALVERYIEGRCPGR